MHMARTWRSEALKAGQRGDRNAFISRFLTLLLAGNGLVERRRVDDERLRLSGEADHLLLLSHSPLQAAVVLTELCHLCSWCLYRLPG